MEFNLKSNCNHSLLEMARVGTFDGYTVSLYSSEGKYPHFHFYNSEKEIEGCIRLDVPEYFIHDGKKDMLDSREKKDLIKWLNSYHKEYKALGVDLTIYKYMCILWNDNNPDHIYNDLQMPDYKLLPNKVK